MSSWLVFPGQGAQTPGMLHRLSESHIVRDCLSEASQVLGEDVLQLDSAAALASTRAVQVCLLVAGVACSRLLLQQAPAPAYVSGLSIGAYPAAVVAGALSFSDALKLVSLRGELMQQAWPQGHGMTAVIGLDQASVEQLVTQLHSERTPVYLANINADNQLVIAGSDEAMAAVGERAKQLGVVVCKRLAVSVPSHCPLLAAPAAALAEAFGQVQVQAPRLGYLSSSRARPLRTAEQIRDELAFNM
ncbi:MAG: malonate decarboxylase subunit epsilon, partial [Pseudomonas sp.]|nr:malonate decarboxylase subunit epsilon [Pseudomonas sp.]